MEQKWFSHALSGGDLRDESAPDSSQILALYDARRAVQRQLGKLLVEQADMPTLHAVAEELGLLREGRLRIDNDGDVIVIGDTVIYAGATDGETLVERAIRKELPSATGHRRDVLQAMGNAYFSVFVLIDAVPGLGVLVKDVLCPGDTYFVVDRAMSQSTLQTGVAMRLLRFNEFAISTGAGVPFPSANAAATLFQTLAERWPEVNADFFRQPSREVKRELCLITLQMLLGADASRADLSEPEYNDDPSASPTPFVRQAPRVGRNDPCPCGSGKKYKRCHGR